MHMTTCAQKSISRDLLVKVNVQKFTAAELIDLTNMLVATTDATFDHGERMRYYTSLTAVQDDFASTTEAYKAAREAFAQSPRMTYLAVGRIFTEDQSAFTESRALADGVVIGDFIAVTDGEFNVTIDGDAQDITALTFAAATDFEDVAGIIQTGIQAIGTGGYTAATCVYDAVADNFIITSGTTGDTSTISSGLTPVTAGAGTDISSASFLNFYDDPGTDTDNLRTIQGYTVGGLADELKLLDDTAKSCLGRPWTGLVLTKEFRDADNPALPSNFNARDAAGWAEANDKLFGTVSNDPNAIDGTIDSDILSDLSENGYRFTTAEYHTQQDYYPEASVIARLLGIDFNARESVITMHGKDLPGVPTVPVSDTDYTVLENKRGNFLGLVERNERFHLTSMSSNSDWWIDETWNILNLTNEIQTRLVSAYKTNGRIPFNSSGRTIIQQAIDGACSLYAFNGTLSARTDSDNNTTPAFTIDVPRAGDVSASDRGARIWRGITVNVNLSGATHSIIVNLNAYV
jgi:hypothetical protein